MTHRSAMHAALVVAIPAAAFTMPFTASAQAHAAAHTAAPVVDKSAKIGPGLYEVVASEAGKAVYVASTGSRETPGAKIFMLDPVTLAVKSTIDVAAAPAYGLAINDRTQTLYTTNTRSSSVSAIDLKSGKVIATIKSPVDTSAHLFRIFVDEASNTVYAAVASNPGKVWIIDGKTNTWTGSIDSLGKQTSAVVVDNATKRLYATSLGTNEISVVDLATRKVISRIAVGQRPTQLALDTKGSRLFVTNQGTGDVSVIDTKTGTVIKSVKTGEGALGIAFNPGTSRLYVANRGSGTVTVIDVTTYEVIANLQAGSRPNTVSVDTKTNAVYVTNKAKAAGRGEAPTVDENGDTVTRIK